MNRTRAVRLPTRRELLKPYIFDPEQNAIRFPFEQALRDYYLYRGLQRNDPYVGPWQARLLYNLCGTLDHLHTFDLLIAKMEIAERENWLEHDWAITDEIDTYLTRFRRVMDDLCQGMAKLPSWPRGSKARSFKSFRDWCCENDSPQADQLVRYIAQQTDWFAKLRELRDALMHQNSQPMLFRLEGGRIGFDIYNYSNHSKAPFAVKEPAKAREVLGGFFLDLIALLEYVRRTWLRNALSQVGLKREKSKHGAVWSRDSVSVLISLLMQQGFTPTSFPSVDSKTEFDPRTVFMR